MEYDMTLAQQSYNLAERWSKTKDTSEFSAIDISGMDANQIGEHEYHLWSLLLTVL
jgi:leukotriene-A4 hydrolase